MHHHSLRTPGGKPRDCTAISCIGIGHGTAPAEVRERFVFPPHAIGDALRSARRDAGIERMVIVSTCHRTELYAELEEHSSAIPGRAANDVSLLLCNWISAYTGVDPALVADHVYVHRGDGAVRHLFRLAAGLESAVPGEPQIIGQIAAALRHSVAAHAASPMLKRVFKEAVRIGERSRASVWSGYRAANIGTAAAGAVALKIRQSGGSLSDARISIVGAGELSELAVSAMTSAGVRDLTVVNRSSHRADKLAQCYGVKTRLLEEIEDCLVASDAAIFALSGTRQIVGMEMLREVMAAREQAALTLIDVGLPRNVEPMVGGLPGVTLLDIDDIGRLGRELYADRSSVSESVEMIVEHGLSALTSRFATSSQAPTAALSLQ